MYEITQIYLRLHVSLVPLQCCSLNDLVGLLSGLKDHSASAPSQGMYLYSCCFHMLPHFESSLFSGPVRYCPLLPLVAEIPLCCLSEVVRRQIIAPPLPDPRSGSHRWRLRIALPLSQGRLRAFDFVIVGAGYWKLGLSDLAWVFVLVVAE